MTILPTTDRPTVSFELFPPRNPDAAPKLWATIERLATARPDFVSVTYGASGSTRETTRALVRRLLNETALNPIAHLTCVGASRAEVTVVVEEFLDEGVRSFLALRGDPPADEPGWRAHPDGLETSADLVRLIREVEAVRCERSPSQAIRATVRPLSIAVAAFPRGNAGAGSTREQDVEALLAKQAAGADFAITQVFYEAAAYLEMVDVAREAGVRIPIIPGVIPTTDPARLVRLEALTGVPVPVVLLDLLGSTDDPAERHRLGTAYGVELIDAVLAGGAPGIHIYTFNRHEAALDLLEGANLGGGAPNAPDLARWPQAGATPAPTKG